MRRFAALAAVVFGFLVTGWGRAEERQRPRVDVVFCIDCSGSMGGVIETAKQKVWEIVNQVARARPVPELRIGLLGYGNGDRTFRVFELSGDLDEVYKNLMTFKDEGWGDEFVGMALGKAVGEMGWAAEGPQALRVVFLVGNETARQGPADCDYAKVAAEAAGKGIVVNAIYCGDTDYAAATPTWREMAKLGTGRYMEIAATGGAIAVATPYDKELAELSGQLNATYLAFGRAGEARLLNQVQQDRNAVTVGGTVVAAQRAAAKTTSFYDSSGWDLVDASKRADFKLADVDGDQLPEEMRKMSVEEREAYVEKKAAERAEIQRKIRELSEKRDVIVREEMKKRGGEVQKAFDENVRQAVLEQAGRKGFQFAE